MPNTIKIKNSAVAAKVPLTTDLDYGELALNYADGKIFYKRSDNTVQSISGGGGAGDVTLAGTQTLTNKTIAFANNTLTGVQPTLVSGTSIKTINSTSLLGSGDIVISGGGSSALTIDNKTGAYTVVAGDLGKIVNCTSGTFTVSLTAAATLGSGFNCWIWNSSATFTDAITIDPAGTETIDGRTTLILRRGEGLQIVCDGTKWQTGDKKAVRGYAENIVDTNNTPIATGNNSVAIHSQATATGNGSFAAGQSADATGLSSLAVGRDTNASGAGSTAIGINSTASADYSSAIGNSSGGSGAQTITGGGAMALGGSYASGTDSFAAAVASNTSTYGAQGANSVAIGLNAIATGIRAVAIGRNCSSSSTGSLAIGTDSTASNTSSVAIGGATSTAAGSIAIGISKSDIANKYTFSGGFNSVFAAVGDAQTGTFVLRIATTDATATVLTSNAGAAAATNQVILPNNSAYAFTGIIVARQQAAGGTQTAAWKVDGLIRREGTAASTVLVNSALTVISNTPGWNIAFSADTTNGGLAVTVTGAAATNIRWVATLQTSEVTYA